MGLLLSVSTLTVLNMAVRVQINLAGGAGGRAGCVGGVLAAGPGAGWSGMWNTVPDGIGTWSPRGWTSSRRPFTVAAVLGRPGTEDM